MELPPVRFSRGGWVPGTGNGDTVPAMLEPGEFVLRKSAAQSFGSQLNGINKYSNGGKTRRSPFPEDLWYHHAIDGDSLNVDYVPKSEKINTSSRLLGFDAFEKSWVDLMTDVHEKHGSWDNRKLYNRWELIEV